MKGFLAVLGGRDYARKPWQSMHLPQTDGCSMRCAGGRVGAGRCAQDVDKNLENAANSRIYCRFFRIDGIQTNV
jgi:hypothetical protein